MKLIKDYTVIAAGALIYALSVVVFTSPNRIAPGGLTGVGTLLNYLFSVPIGTFILVMNVPLFLLGLRGMGRGFVVKTLVATALVSVLIDVLSEIAVPYRGDVMLAAVFGGIFNGAGLALVFSAGGSTGGTDIVATTLHRRIPQFSVGHIILACDALVVTVAGLVYSSVESSLYAVISIFVASKLIDVITYGTSRDNGKLMLIITAEHRAILKGILAEIPRGVTVVDAVGGYSSSPKKLLVCALRPRQIFRAMAIVKNHDKNAFVIVTTATEISGLGFKN